MVIRLDEGGIGMPQNSPLVLRGYSESANVPIVPVGLVPDSSEGTGAGAFCSSESLTWPARLKFSCNAVFQAKP